MGLLTAVDTEFKKKLAHKLHKSYGMSIKDAEILYELIMEAFMEGMAENNNAFLESIGRFRYYSYNNRDNISFKFIPCDRLVQKIKHLIKSGEIEKPVKLKRKRKKKEK